MCVCVPVKILESRYSRKDIAKAITKFKCQAPHCQGGFNMYSLLCVVQGPNGAQAMLIHNNEDCVGGAKAAGWHVVNEVSTHLLAEIFGLPQQLNSPLSSMPPLSPAPLRERLPAHGLDRTPRRFVKRNFMQVAHH